MLDDVGPTCRTRFPGPLVKANYISMTTKHLMPFLLQLYKTSVLVCFFSIVSYVLLSITQTERDLFSLPVRLGGLGIPIFTEKATSDYINSKMLTAPLTAIIVLQGYDLPDENSVKCIRADVTKSQSASLTSKTSLIEQNIDSSTFRAVKQAQEKGAGSWLNVLPLEEQGFTLTKGEFRDALALRYNKQLRGLPSKCSCGQTFGVNHALNCKRGGFVIIRHHSS